VLKLILEIGKPFGLRAIRLPYEISPPFWLKPWLLLLKRRLTAAGIAHNDYLAGIRYSGRFDEAALLKTLTALPTHGVGEIYFHPALVSGAEVGASMPDYRHADEFAALISPRVRVEFDRLGICRGGFADLLHR
jgi:hypothetical protein